MIIQRPVVISVLPLMAHRFISQTHWISGTWYLQADRSALSVKFRDFLSDGARAQAQWYWGDARYN